MCGQVADGMDRDVGASSQKLTATARCARRSEVSDIIRDPVNRQTTITLVTASMPLPSAQRGSRHFRRRMSARFPPGTFSGEHVASGGAPIVVLVRGRGGG
jgi:hypothetical protein